MARGDFGKAYGEHRRNGGVLSRKAFADEWVKAHPKPVRPEKDNNNTIQEDSRGVSDE